MIGINVDEKKPQTGLHKVHPLGIDPHLLALAALLVATALTYSSTFHFGWVYDDPPQIPQNPNLQWSRLGFLFTHQLWASTVAMQSRFYRPFLTLWFLINKSIFGLNPHWFHLTTVLAHIAATTLAFFIARSFLRDPSAAVFAAALFALHPLQAESVSWISAVNDPLAAIFCFASFLACRRALASRQHRLLWWAAAGVLFLFALLTKEVSIVLPGIVLVDLWIAQKKGGQESKSRSFLPLVCAYGTVALAWLGFRAWVLGHSASASAPISWTAILLSAPRILLFDLYRVVVPIGLSPQYDFHLVGSFNMDFFLFAAVLAALIALAVVAAQRYPQIWVALAWLILPILPTLNLRWMNQGDFIHDRYTYISMLGVALLTGTAYRWVIDKWSGRKLVQPLAVALVLSLAFASAIQSQYWANNLVLFSRAVSRAPENEWAQLNYGSALSTRGKYSEAASHFVRSYELNPGWRAADFAGFAYQHSGNLEQAERWFTTALQQSPNLAIAWFGLAQIRLQQHQPLEAIDYLKKAIEFEPDADGFHYLMGTALEQTSQLSQAADEYRTELRLHPGQTASRDALDRIQPSLPNK
jgi:tetratricopeptide (TPR) repeat protein